MDKKLLRFASINSLLVLIYVMAVAFLMSNADKIFGAQDNSWTPVAVLMLLVLSAAIVGSLVFARPVMMFLDGAKKEAVKLLMYTIGCLAVLTIIAIAVVASIK